MMTMDDGFDAKLAAAFARADEQIPPSKEFVEQLLGRLGHERRQRWMVLGSAASAGSLIAASQVQNLASEFQVQTGIFAHVFAIISPEAMVSLVLATMMAGFGLMLSPTNR